MERYLQIGDDPVIRDEARIQDYLDQREIKIKKLVSISPLEVFKDIDIEKATIETDTPIGTISLNSGALREPLQSDLYEIPDVVIDLNPGGRLKREFNFVISNKNKKIRVEVCFDFMNGEYIHSLGNESELEKKVKNNLLSAIRGKSWKPYPDGTWSVVK